MERPEKKETAEDTARDAIKNPSLMPEIIEGLSSENPRIKFRSAKALQVISEKRPALLYPKMDFFASLLDNKNNILKWTAMDVIANLTPIDSDHKFDKIFKKYYGFLSADSMITLGHVIDNSWKIAKAKPMLTPEITKQLLSIEQIRPNPQITPECKNILIGKAIQAFDKYYSQIENKNDVIAFVKRQLHNTRNATKVKAKNFLSKHT